jgi:hypothetical protein
MSKNKISRHKHKRQRTEKPVSPLWFIVAGIAGLSIILFFAFHNPTSSGPSAVSGGPNLNADKQEVDLGDVKLGIPVQVSFELTNTGSQPLQFSKAPYIEVREGC